MSETYHFQVNLGGMLDVLSNHLYKSPDVFLRELLQNGVDAITLRQKEQPGWSGGRITITVEPGRRLIFRDNGAGLGEQEIHRFLAVIGQSSKTELMNGRLPEDYIGRFGIGLLSCFMVSDSIVVHTRPAEGGAAHVWTGLPDGTYTLEPLEDCPAGTAVILTAKPGMEGYFQEGRVAELVRYYGLTLPVPVYLAGNPERLNCIPADFSGVSRGQLLALGEWMFEEEFLEAIPIQTPHISGAAYVVPYRTSSAVRGKHRIYLKQMLLTERGDTLLPPWAFFLQCFLNTNGLRPTASREDFYEDEELDAAREEFAGAVRSHLARLAEEAPDRLKSIISVHVEAIKAMAVWDEELFRLFIDYLTFETSEGYMTGAALKRAGEAVWIHSVPKFKQLRPIFAAQGRLLICTGYASDQELIQSMAERFALPLYPLQEENMYDALEEATADQRQQGAALLQAADQALSSFECRAHLRRFLPADLPVLYAMSDEVQFLRQLQTAQEQSGSIDQALSSFECRAHLRRFLPADLPVLYAMSDEVQFLRQLQTAQEQSGSIFSDALASMISEVEERPLAVLYLNLNSPIIRRLCMTTDTHLLESMVQVLYVQALLAGGHPLRGGELKTMNQALLELIRRLCMTTDTHLLESMVQVLYVQALLAGGHPLRGGELKTMNQALLELLEHVAEQKK